VVDGLAFSKDRPAQLALLLDSVAAHAPTLYSTLTVLWRGSSPAYDAGYRRVFAEHPSVVAVHEGIAADTFCGQTLEWFASAGAYVGFLVDDLVFYRDVPTDRLYDSYRLGSNVTYCYPLDVRQISPVSHGITGRWLWRDQPAGDWSYPMSLDAHVYKRDVFGAVLDGLRFVDPNTLEHGLAVRARERFEPLALSAPPLSCAVSIPANLVNRSVANRHGQNPGELPLVLRDRYLSGERLDVDLTFAGVDVNACHQEIELKWRKRR
jgi:hypothetical protein